MRYDHLVVGQGIAGSLLAWELLRRGRSVRIVDRGVDCASRVSAGILNPVTGKRLVKSWLVDELLPAAHHLYRELETELGGSWLTPRRILRVYQSADEPKRWEKRRLSPAYEGYLGRQFAPGEICDEIHDPWGSFEILRGGNLAIAELLEALQARYLERGILRQETFDHGRLKLNAEGASYEGDQFGSVVFCEGFQVRRNPWFNWLPFAPAKGEILTFARALPEQDYVLNRQKWVLPLPDGRCRVGSTWSHDHIDTVITSQGRTGLFEGMRKMLNWEEMPAVVRHEAGVRPCTHDRLPIIGFHPEHAQLVLFNGFGSKGALATPLWAARLADRLGGQAVDLGETDLSRWIDSPILQQYPEPL
ncbi:MAG: FAD dependent oxidoreductase [Puniceicoccaceae bacterium 5H]|nr:MAG: FAD dependent oxidoreductase [Puniceicoccaceae bacterium 5H]